MTDKVKHIMKNNLRLCGSQRKFRTRWHRRRPTDLQKVPFDSCRAYVVKSSQDEGEAE